MKKLYFFLVALMTCMAANAATVAVAGSFNSWSTTQNSATVSGTLGEVIISNWPSGAEFKYLVDGSWYSCGSSNVPVDGSWQNNNGGGNMKLNSAADGKTIKFTIATNTKSFKAEIVSDAPSTTTWCLHGSFASSTWVDVELTGTGDELTAKNVTVSYGSAEFGVKEMKGGKQSGWWAASTSTSINGNASVTLVNSNTSNISIAAGVYDFTFNTTSKLLTVTKQGGSSDPVNPPVTETKVYFVGAQTDWLTNKIEMTKVGNDYTVVLEDGITGPWKVCDGSWAWSFGKGANDVVVGTETDAWFNSSVNFGLTTTGKTTVKFTLVEGSDVQDSSIASKVLVTTEGGSTDPVNPPVTDDPFNIYFDNTSSNWTTPYIHYWGGTESTWPGVAMTKVTGNIWVKEVPAATTGILFNAGDGDATKTQDFAAVADHVYTTAGDQGEYTGSTEPDPVDPPETETKVYFVGAQTDWLTNKIEMTKSGNDYTVVLEDGITGPWKVCDGSWAWSFGKGANDVVVGTETDAWFNSSVNFGLTTTGKTTVKFTLVEGSDVQDSSIASKVLVTTEGGSTDPVEPPVTDGKVYFVGAQTNWLENKIEMTKSGNDYTVVLEGGITGEWKICNGTWDWNFGMGENDVVPGVETDAWFNSPANFGFTTSGKTIVTFTFVEGSDVQDSSIPSKVFVATEGNIDGIDSINVDNAAAEKVYYDLSGRRVMNPTSGLYICNGKKIYIK